MISSCRYWHRNPYEQ